MFQSRNFIKSSPVCFNLIVINLICLLATMFFSEKFGFSLNDKLGLHFVMSDKFYFYQFFTYMFMHGGLEHLFFNMFAVYMFGSVFEQIWGGKKFLFYYFIAGLGAAALQQLVWSWEYFSLMNKTADFSLLMQEVMTNGADVIHRGMNYTDKALGSLNLLMNIPTVGASGAVFGILLAFGFMFPQEKLFLFFIPIPIPARVFVVIYGVIELIGGVANFSWDNIAHFAHLGGLIAGLVVVLIWRKQNKLFNQVL